MSRRRGACGKEIIKQDRGKCGTGLAEEEINPATVCVVLEKKDKVEARCGSASL